MDDVTYATAIINGDIVLCPLCKEWKELDLFNKHSGKVNGRNSYCKLCDSRTSSEHNATRDKKEQYYIRRSAMLKKKFNISVEDYDKLYINQQGCCALCLKTGVYPDYEVPKETSLAVDHCHKTGLIRGLLCVSCNVAIGRYESFILPNMSAITKYLS